MKILQFKCGTNFNVIPGECRVLVKGGREIADKIPGLAHLTGGPCSAEVTDEGVWLTTTGITGHGSMPEGKRNAIGMMLVLLKELGAEGAIRTLADAVGIETDARGMGCAYSSAEYGSTICNLGVLELKDGQWRGMLDFRLPYTVDADMTEKQVKAHLPGFKIERHHFLPCLFLQSDDPVFKALTDAFGEETGMNAEAVVMRGGTYAKIFKRGVAFGPLFPNEKPIEHQADENMRTDHLIQMIKIYANAFSRVLL